MRALHLAVPAASSQVLQEAPIWQTTRTNLQQQLPLGVPCGTQKRAQRVCSFVRTF